MSNDTMYGSAGQDSLYGGDGQDRLKGDSGDHTLFGGSENDVLYGGSENDRLYGDSGQDSLTGGDGNDTLEGGSGADVFFFHPSENGVDTVVDMTAEDMVYLLIGKTITDIGLKLPDGLVADGDDIVLALDAHTSIRFLNMTLDQFSADMFYILPV